MPDNDDLPRTNSFDDNAYRTPEWEASRAELDAEDALMCERAIHLLAEMKVAEMKEASGFAARPLPTLTTRAGVRKYIAEVSEAVRRKEITGQDARLLLYTAQLALSSIKGEEKKRPVGRPSGHKGGDR